MSNYRIVEIEGRIYSVVEFDMRPRGGVEDMYQRLEKNDSALGRKWHGTRLAADHAFDERKRLRQTLKGLRR